MNKICSVCKEEKPSEEYYNSSNSKNGKVSACKSCSSKRAKAYYKKDKKKYNEASKNWYKNNKDKKLKQNREWINNNVFKRLANIISRRNINLYNSSICISEKDLIDIYNKQNKKCFYTGLDMTLERGRGHKYNDEQVSIDRIDSNKPYTLNNICLCCWRVNSMKNNMDTNKFLEWCKLIVGKRND